MPWFLAGLYSCLCLCVVTAGISLPPIHWNASNPMFKSSNNDHLIEVHLYDDIDFVCPHYPGEDEESDRLEFYTIHQVTKREYDECYLNSSYPAVAVVDCNNPAGPYRKRFTIIFEPFSAIPNVPEYRSGGTYYFITTSTGTHHGLSNDHQGACLYKNMKLTVKVCCDSTTVKPLSSSGDGRSTGSPAIITPSGLPTVHTKSTVRPVLTTHTSASTTKATSPTPVHIRTTSKHRIPIEPTDKPPGPKDKGTTPDKKDENDTKPNSPDYSKGPANRTSSHHHSASWTLNCLALCFLILLQR